MSFQELSNCLKRRLQTTDEVNTDQRPTKKPKTAAGEVSEVRDTDRIWSARNIKTKYAMHKRIGKGGGGVVYSAIRKEDGKKVAIKRVKKLSVKRWGEIEGHIVPIEFELLHKASGHPNIIEMIEWFERRKEYLLVMERQKQAIDLFEAVKSDGLPEMIARRVFCQIAEAALHCHSKGVLHRDIKDSNILFNPVTFEAKLIDFGAGTRLKNEPYTKFAGTKEYYPPEWFTEHRYDGRRLDAWCLGILLYIMVEGAEPFEDVESILKCEIRHERGGRVSELCRQFIGLLLHKDAEKRPTIEEALKHPWVRQERGEQ